MSKPIRRILSIDGGGVRGIIPARILATIEQRTGKPVCELFDLIAGTSTGGIVALALTKPDAARKPEFSAEKLCELYDENIPRIFRNPQNWWGNLLQPKYTQQGFQKVMKTFMGEVRLKESLVDLVIPCYDIEHRMPYIFRSSLAKKHMEDDFLMRDVALATSASPTLFHPVEIERRSTAGRKICLVDGGVYANNPTICGYAEDKANIKDPDQEHFVVSIGTGKSSRTLSDASMKLWGYVQWSRPMLELVMESSSESVHQQIRYLLAAEPSRQFYYRLQVDLPEHTNFAIDDTTPKNLNALASAAEDYCASSAELSRVCERLLSLSQVSESAEAKAH